MKINPSIQYSVIIPYSCCCTYTASFSLAIYQPNFIYLMSDLRIYWWWRLKINPERGRKVLQNVGILLQHYMMSQPRSPQPEFYLLVLLWTQ